MSVRRELIYGLINDYRGILIGGTLDFTLIKPDYPFSS